MTHEEQVNELFLDKIANLIWHEITTEPDGISWDQKRVRAILNTAIITHLQAAQPVWTRERPQEGWYWFQNYQAGFAPEVYTISQPNGPDTDELAVDNMDDQPLDEFLEDYGPGEWAGPIQLPREA